MHDVALLDHVVRALDKAIVVHADVNEGADGRHVGDHSIQHHAGAQIRDLLDAISECCQVVHIAQPGRDTGRFGASGSGTAMRTRPSEIRRVSGS